MSYTQTQNFDTRKMIQFFKLEKYIFSIVLLSLVIILFFAHKTLGLRSGVKMRDMHKKVRVTKANEI